MDDLTRDVMEAEKAGMTYGKWKALQYANAKKPRRKVKTEGTEDDTILENEGICIVCGAVFIRNSGAQKMCSERCRIARRTKLQNERYARKVNNR